MAQIVLNVEGMSCNHCKMAVEKALSKVPGVSHAAVDLAAKKASVDYDPAVATRDLMVKAVEDAGYSVSA
ncbi:MAG TPA: copper ion binding protein [Spirochaetia bacterium]|nr:copper ion binding protein [Spirochaetia bacterium]